MKDGKKNDGKKKVVIVVAFVVLTVAIVAGILFLGKYLKGNISLSLADKANMGDITINNEDKAQVDPTVVPKGVYASVPIFMYHFILEDYGNYPDTENFLKPETLEEQLKYLSENGYQTIFMDEMDDLYKYEKPVGLTFDDCFVYFYNNAFPLLKKYNQKATIFVITDYINGENYLTEEQIKEIADSGLVKVESHSKSHQYLDLMTYDEQYEEAVGSKERLEAITGQKVSVYCYPSGRFNQTTLDIIKDHYDFGLEMLGGVCNTDTQDNYHITRIYANRTMPLSTFASHCSASKVKVID